MNVLDLKGLVDRKLMAITEEMPLQIRREVKSFELKEQELMKDVSAKFQNIQEGTIRTRDQLKQR